MLLALVFIVGLFAAISWYYFTHPIPSGIAKQTWKAKVFLGHIKMGMHFAILCENLGIQNRVKILQKLTDIMVVVQKKRFTPWSDVKITDSLFADVPVRIYEPKGKHINGPGMIFLHGGGWCLGTAESYDPLICRVTRKTGMVIVSVDYRLAPRYTFPVPLDDCENATMYFMKNSQKYAVDPNRIAIAGDSAGGNLAAAVCLRLRDRGFIPKIKQQVLLYPALQPIDFNLPSYQQNRNDPISPQNMLAVCWLNYAKGDFKEWKSLVNNNHITPEFKKTRWASFVSHDSLPLKCFPDSYKPLQDNGCDIKLWDELKDTFLNPHFAPLMAEDLSGLPHAFIVTCKHDTLRNDGMLYAKRLEDDGVDVCLVDYEEAIHGIMSFFTVFHKGKEIIDTWADYLVKSM